jgi:hypothetical protein
MAAATAQPPIKKVHDLGSQRTNPNGGQKGVRHIAELSELKVPNQDQKQVAARSVLEHRRARDPLIKEVSPLAT